MPATSHKGAQKAKRKATKKTASGKSATPHADSKETAKKLTSSEENFVRGVLIRGEAATATPEGELPSGATHEIVEEHDDGLPTIERKRFSAY